VNGLPIISTKTVDKSARKGSFITVDAYSNDWDEKSLGMELKTLEPLGIILTEARQPNLHFPEVGS